ncbi:hypothetical protein AOLI_G00017250 [Acnodon oligacanthus]
MYEVSNLIHSTHKRAPTQAMESNTEQYPQRLQRGVGDERLNRTDTTVTTKNEPRIQTRLPQTILTGEALEEKCHYGKTCKNKRGLKIHKAGPTVEKRGANSDNTEPQVDQRPNNSGHDGTCLDPRGKRKKSSSGSSHRKRQRVEVEDTETEDQQVLDGEQIKYPLEVVLLSMVQEGEAVSRQTGSTSVVLLDWCELQDKLVIVMERPEPSKDLID